MIYINGRFLLQKQTGVNRFAYEICLALINQKIEFILLCPNGKINECYDVSKFTVIFCGFGKSHVWEQLSLPLCFWKMKSKNNILVNFTGIGPIIVGKKIMTIHDLAFMVNSSWYSFIYSALYKLLTPLSVSTSKKILTVSEFSKNEIVRLMSVKPNRISVIYNAVSSSFKNIGNLSSYKETKTKYILAVSSIDPRKNFNRLLKAFSMLNDIDIKLYVIGGQNKIYSTSVEELCNGIPKDRIEWLGYVSDRKLIEYYTNASVFIYPSLYEGFGIPPLEAMSCGVPTIVSDIPPLREVCGDASLYVDPNDESDISQKIRLLLSDVDLQKKLRNGGFERCKSFDWNKSASKLVSVIDSLRL